jgi:hypothetical protein
MLTTTQPSRSPTWVIGSSSSNVAARELALGVVVIHEDREAAVGARVRPFEHLAVAAGVADGEQRRATDLRLDVLELGAALVGLAELGDRAAHEGAAGLVATELVADQRADDHARLDAVQRAAELTDELGAAARDDADGEIGRAQLGEQLEHRLVDDPAHRNSEGPVPISADELVDRGAEARRGLAVEQRRQRPRHVGQANLADRGLVAAQDLRELRTAGQRLVLLGSLPERVDEEVELHVGGLLAPHRAVVVDVRDALVGRHVADTVEEREDRVAGGPGPP